jgi:hypothetical protein
LRVKTAAQAAQNWSASAGRAQAAYVAGIQSTTKDQAGLAVAAQARLLTNFTQAVSSGYWARQVQAAGTGYWKSQSENKQANFGVGFAAGANNYSVAAGKILAAEAQIVSSLPARGDINANLQRANAFALALHAQKGNLGAR